MFKKFFVILFLSFFIPSCGGGGGGNDNNTNSDPDTDPDTTNNVSEPTIKNNFPIGLSSFALAVPTFPVDDLLSIDSSLSRVATNELYTFPEKGNREQIVTTIKKLIESGHDVFHEIHVLNGPGMRQSKDYWINGVVGRPTSDSQFISLLQGNAKVRDAVLNLFAEVVAEAKVLQQLGAEVVICPELEDNHEGTKTFQILVDMLHKVGWTDNSKIVRNTYKGRPIPGLRTEAHANRLSQLMSQNLKAGDIQNNDGVDVQSIGETELKKMIQYCHERGIIFYLWVSESQGLKHVTGGQPWQMVNIGAYNQRHYSFPNPDFYQKIFKSVDTKTPIDITTEKLIFSKFLWKPSATSSYNPGGLIIHNDSCNASAFVNGEKLKDYGPGNGRCGTYRSMKPGCQYGTNIKVEIFDNKTNQPYYYKDNPYVIIPNGCQRVEINK